ncbi:MAG: hypothetical protein UY02_C0015G0001 [Candidatus Giovannonibacteria bacterium GW2011_GWB1_47_6b]|uniref:Septum formation initiator n=1 Tax=Candidatus Giovannonibacteria bacterium GW2011_GWB1_47_6b TaxID=1618655 RepID=A0A0G1T4C4_9BACT|nr:MAG: hypothetical protein UY02_C0015G0001 [Candidatus Giovannonibacteria bacterium GW2011_GWB1_47_6b]
MKMVVWGIAVAILGVMSVQLFRIIVDDDRVGANLDKARTEAQALKLENEQLQSDINYFSKPENLIKEFKAKFDYKKPGEKLIKIQ